MGRRKFNPNDRPPVRFVDDEELAYVATRSREVHDLWHVLFQCPTTVQGELALKALEFAQTGRPMAALGAFAPIRWTLSRRRFLFEEMPVGARGGEGGGFDVPGLRERDRDGPGGAEAQVADNPGAEAAKAAEGGYRRGQDESTSSRYAS